MSHDQIFAILLVLCCGYALLLGGAPERIGALAIVLGSVVSIMVTAPWATRNMNVEVGVLLVDLAMFLVFLAMALVSRRFWPLWVAGLLGVQVLSHLLGLPPSLPLNLTYAIVNRSLGYAIVPMIAVATLRHRQRMKRDGADPSWLRSWKLAVPAMPSGRPSG